MPSPRSHDQTPAVSGAGRIRKDDRMSSSRSNPAHPPENDSAYASARFSDHDGARRTSKDHCFCVGSRWAWPAAQSSMSRLFAWSGKRSGPPRDCASTLAVEGEPSNAESALGRSEAASDIEGRLPSLQRRGLRCLPQDTLSRPQHRSLRVRNRLDHPVRIASRTSCFVVDADRAGPAGCNDQDEPGLAVGCSLLAARIFPGSIW